MFTASGLSFIITIDHMHIIFTTSNVIYCIKCSSCNMLYLRVELDDVLAIVRVRDHLYDIGNKDRIKPVSLHFNFSNYLLWATLLFSVFL